MPPLESPGILTTLLAFVLVLGPLVFIHELGHYLVGRWFGVVSSVCSSSASAGLEQVVTVIMEVTYRGPAVLTSRTAG